MRIQSAVIVKLADNALVPEPEYFLGAGHIGLTT
jgi:hypothetical protein